MAIGGVGSYGNYTNSYVRNNNVKKSEKTEEAEDTAMTKEEFLKELKKEFPEMNLYTARVTKDNQNKFATFKGQYNVAISDEYFDEVLKDPQKRAEFKKSLNDIKDATNYLIDSGKQRGRDIYTSGFIIDAEGGMNAWCGSRVPTASNNGSNNIFGTNNPNKNNTKNTVLGQAEESIEKRRTEQKEQEKKRLEKRELERKEEKEAQDERVEKQRDEKRLEERRAKEREIEEKLAEIFKEKKVEHTFIYDDEPKVKNNFVSAFNSPSIKFKNNNDLVGKYQSDLDVGVEQGFSKEI